MGERVIELMIDMATEEFLPRLERSVCGRCYLKPVCERLETGCVPLTILEELFLLGRISYREATRRPELPNSGAMTRVKVPKKVARASKTDTLRSRTVHGFSEAGKECDGLRCLPAEFSYIQYSYL